MKIPPELNPYPSGSANSAIWEKMRLAWEDAFRKALDPKQPFVGDRGCRSGIHFPPIGPSWEGLMIEQYTCPDCGEIWERLDL